MTLVDGLFTGEHGLIDLLRVGEIGDGLIPIIESVTDFDYDLTAKMVSQISFSVYDPGFNMLNNNFFLIGRRVEFGIYPGDLDTDVPVDSDLLDLKYSPTSFEIVAIEASYAQHDIVRVTARSAGMQALKKEKGQQSFGRISPTAFAEQAAERVNLRFFGEFTNVEGNIVREQNDDKDESTYDVLKRLASEAEFMFFESNNVLFFASEKYIIENQPRITLNLPSNDNDSFYVSNLTVRKSTDSKDSSATIQVNLLKNTSSVTLFPGVGVEVKGLNGFTLPFMVDKVNYDASASGFVSISGTAVEDTEDMMCELETFQRGSRGDCVKRIQQAMNTFASEVSTGSGFTYTSTSVSYVINTPVPQIRSNLSQAEIDAFRELGLTVEVDSNSSGVAFRTLAVDGVFGPRTEAAVKAFQSNYGLAESGVVDAETWFYIKTPGASKAE